MWPHHPATQSLYQSTYNIPSQKLRQRNPKKCSKRFFPSLPFTRRPKPITTCCRSSSPPRSQSCFCPCGAKVRPRMPSRWGTMGTPKVPGTHRAVGVSLTLRAFWRMRMKGKVHIAISKDRLVGQFELISVKLIIQKHYSMRVSGPRS